MIRFRIISSVIFFAIFFLGLYLPEFTWILTSIIVIATLIAGLEYYSLVRGRGYHPQVFLGLIIQLFILLAAILGNMDMIPILLLLALMLTSALHILQFGEKNIAAETAISLMGCIYIALPMALLLSIINQKEFFGAAPAVVFLVVVTCFCDIGAYVVGKKFGKRPLSPELSPKKTVEGSIGGTAFAIGIAMFLVWAWHDVDKVILIPWAIILAILFSVIGQIGDLVESALKRDVAIKDSGINLTGHGGILDIIDSLLFCTPIMFLYLMLLFPEINWL